MIRRPPRSTLFPTRRSSDLIVGSVSEKTMLDRVFREPALVDERVERVMDPPFPVVQATDDIERLYQELSGGRSEEHTSELQSQSNLVCRLLLEKKKTI